MQNICQNVCKLTRQVGSFIKNEQLNFSSAKVEIKGKNDFVSYVDKAAEQKIIDGLSVLIPESGFIAEEGTSTKKGIEYNWIIDPLDGTQEFSEPERQDWAVHVALWQRDETNNGDLVAGAVSLPAIELTLSTDPPHVSPEKQDRPPRLVTSRTRTPREAVIVANALGCDAMRLGSAGAKAMSVVLGECDIYLHSGGQHQWDSAAPVAVARAAGFFTSRIDGSPLIYNDSDTWLPDLIICRADLAESVLTALHKSTR